MPLKSIMDSVMSWCQWQCYPCNGEKDRGNVSAAYLDFSMLKLASMSVHLFICMWDVILRWCNLPNWIRVLSILWTPQNHIALVQATGHCVSQSMHGNGTKEKWKWRSSDPSSKNVETNWINPERNASSSPSPLCTYAWMCMKCQVSAY